MASKRSSATEMTITIPGQLDAATRRALAIKVKKVIKGDAVPADKSIGGVIKKIWSKIKVKFSVTVSYG